MPSPRLTSLLLVNAIVFLLTWGLGSSLATDYKRDYFGDWKDFDHDGQDTRQEMLANTSMLGYVYQDSAGKVVAGMWVCPYTGRIFYDPAQVDVDHIVPLQWAWEHGANSWPDAKREEFANDPSNLLVVWSSANRSKGAKGPCAWLPPNVAFWIEYINKFIIVCKKYNLSYPENAFQSLIIYAVGWSKGITPNTRNRS